MNRGCLANILFAILVVIAFGISTYVWFSIFVRGKTVSTPNLIGKSSDDAKAICSDLGVNLKVDDKVRSSDRVPAGDVAWQNPAPGTTNLIKRGATITVQLSTGPLVLRVPDFAGARQGTAVLRLEQQSLKPGYMSEVDYSQQGVLAADPPKDTVVNGQTPISLLVGVAPPPPQFVMPDLIDHPLDEVRPYLEAHGLVVSTVKFEAYPGIRDGIIIR
ncbi:MAG TPA: PASTA domain-containing protein, partial [Thermoanaerobaculia bacterium]|nr:PASTA domain-containing protein [Thermoanaerobaculia bacterium]